MGEKKEKTLNAKLFVRILPDINFSYDSIKIETNKKIMYIRRRQDIVRGVKPKDSKYWQFCTDGIFMNTCQSEVYESVTAGLFDNLFDGVRSIIFCYGQTGAGKTFTTSALRYNFQDRGLILRIISRLFEEEKKKEDVMKITVGMTYLEFIGDNVRDLISNKPVDNLRKTLEHSVQSEACAWRKIFNAESKKLYSEAAPYQGSNRGHSVLTLYTHAESLIDTDPVITHSKIHIVDMAGFDSYGNKPSAWKHKQDLGHSNVSKSMLEQLIRCLTQDTLKCEKNICRFTSSKFLLYLRDTLQPNSLIRFIAHIYGNEANIPITTSALKFGERIRTFKPMKLERIYESNCTLRVRNLEREFIRLRDETELAGMLRDSPDYSNISQERLLEIQRAAEGFLFGQLESLTLFSLGQATLTLEVFRDLYMKLSTEKDQMVKEAVAAATEMFQAQLADARASSSTLISMPSNPKFTRKKSRRPDSQLSVRATQKSSESFLPAVAKPTSAIAQAGVVDRNGIGIGPGKTASNFEGNVTKAFKKLRSRMSDSVVTKSALSPFTKDFGVPSSKHHIRVGISESVPESVPLRDEAWAEFVTKKNDLVTELKNNIRPLEEFAINAKKKYTESLAEVARIRGEIAEIKNTNNTCKHIRTIYGSDEEIDEGCNLLTEDFERNILEVVTQKEELVNAAIENCHMALINLKNAVSELNEAKNVLEEAFQNFCKERYTTIYMVEEYVSDPKTEVESRPKICPRVLAQMEMFAHLQEKLFNYVPKNAKPKWISFKKF